MGVDVQSKLRVALGSVKDHASIGKAMITNYDGFSDVEIAVVRATSHDNTPVDDAHMHEILFLVSNNSPAASVPFLAERISRRLSRTRDRLVALKTLMLVHRLLRGGSRSFEQLLRRAHLSGHLQISVVSSHAFPCLGFLRNYADYLEERLGWAINQAGKLEPAVSGQAEFQCYKDKSLDLVFRRLPKCQTFLDRVLACSPELETMNTIFSTDLPARAAMTNILKESFQVYTTFSEGVATLMNMFFDLTRSARALACDILKRASRQSQDLQELYKKCKKIMDNKSLNYPCVQLITMDHVEALEQCLTTSHHHHHPIHECLMNSTKEEEEEEEESRSEFSCSMETKISMVWVVFEDKDSSAKSGVIGNYDHKVMADIREPCSFPMNPFAACLDTRIVL